MEHHTEEYAQNPEGEFTSFLSLPGNSFVEVRTE